MDNFTISIEKPELFFKSKTIEELLEELLEECAKSSKELGDHETQINKNVYLVFNPLSRKMMEISEDKNKRLKQIFDFAFGHSQCIPEIKTTVETNIVKGTEYGQICNRNGCKGKLDLNLFDIPKSCYVNLPDNYVEEYVYCPECGWNEDGDEDMS